MRPAQKARRRLHGRWVISIAVQAVELAAWMILLLAELTVLRLTGVGAESVVHLSSLPEGNGIYAAVIAGMLILDWLVLSPLDLGRRLYYWKLAEGEEAPLSLLFVFYGQHYARSLHWRFSLFLRRLLWSALCYLPAALLTGYAELVRQSGVSTPLSDIIMMFCTVFGGVLLLAGGLVSELLMLRYFLASYLLLLRPDEPVGRLFRESRLRMRGRVGELFWICIGLIGWFVSCLLLIPYFYVAPLFETVKAQTARHYLRQGQDGNGVPLPYTILPLKN